MLDDVDVDVDVDFAIADLKLKYCTVSVLGVLNNFLTTSGCLCNSGSRHAVER